MGEFALYFDAPLERPTPYRAGGEYLEKARDRMDRTFAAIRQLVRGKVVVDIGASPFYLLYRCKAEGAARAHGIFFANDEHPLQGCQAIHSDVGEIELSHANLEQDGIPFPDDGVDVVAACEILEHFDHFPATLAKEVHRVLKPGGHLIITVPNVSAIANIIKLIFHKNIYYPYRADHTGRHKHEYTLSQLKAFIGYLGMDVVKAGYLPSPTSDKFVLRPAYRLLAAIPFLKSYSPVLYILARQPEPKPAPQLDRFPPQLFDDALSIEA